MVGIAEGSGACSSVSDIGDPASISGSFFALPSQHSTILPFEEDCECTTSPLAFSLCSLLLRRNTDRQIAKLTKKLTKSTIIPMLHTIAITIPTTTRGMGSSPIGSLTNGMRAAVVEILTIERNRERTSEPLVWPGRKTMRVPKINSSTTTSPMTWVNPWA
jgi:hypothetical protein